MAVDLTTYTEVDVAGNRLQNITATKVDIVALQNDEEVWLYKDFGTDFFIKDINMDFDAEVTSGSTNARAIFWSMTNELDDANNIAADIYSVEGFNNGSGVTFQVQLQLDGVGATDAITSLSLATTYYFKVRIVSADSPWGTLFLDIYGSDANRTNEASALANLSIRLSAKAATPLRTPTFRYLFWAQSYNSASSNSITGFVENPVINDVVSAPTYTFPQMTGSTEDLTTYIETDNDGDLTVTSAKVVATTGFDSGQVIEDKGAEYYTGPRVQFQTKATGNSGAGSQTAVFGLSNTNGPIANWVTGHHIDWVYDGSNYQLKSFDITTGYTDISSNLSASTDYFCEFRRVGKRVSLFIFSDAIYSTWVDTLEIYDITDEETFRYIYAMVSDGHNPASWDIIAFDWDNLTGWTETGSGTSEIDPAGQLHLLPDASNNIGRFQDLGGGLPDIFTIEFSIYFDAIGNQTSGNGFIGNFRNGTNDLQPYIYSDKVGFLEETAGATFTALTTNSATDYTFRLIMDSVANTAEMYRKTNSVGLWTLVASTTDPDLNAGNDGRHMLRQFRGGSGTSECHIDYTYTTTGAFRPDRTLGLACEIENLHENVITISDFSYPAAAIPGTVENDADSYPDGMTENEPAGTTVEQSSIGGRNRVHIVGKTDGTADASLSQTFTAATETFWEGYGISRLASLADGDVARLFGLEDVSSGDILGCGVFRSGSEYFWCLLTKKSGTWTLTQSDFTLSLDTDYKTILNMNYESGSASQAITFVVEGELVAQLDGTSWGSFLADKVYIGGFGGEGDYGADADRSVVDFYYRKDEFLKFGDIAEAPNGDWVVAASSRSKHGQSMGASIKIITSPDGIAWTLRQTIDTTDLIDPDGTDDLGGAQMITVGSNMYYFPIRGWYTRPNAWTNILSDGWKSTNNGVTWTKIWDSDLDFAMSTGDFWDNLVEPWTDFSAGWSEAGTGTTEISPAGEYHSHADASNAVSRVLDIGAIGVGFTAEFEINVTSIENEATGNGWIRHRFEGSAKMVDIKMYADKIGVLNEAATYDYVASTLSTSTDYTYFVKADMATPLIKIYRKTGGAYSLVGTWVDIETGTPTDGNITFLETSRDGSVDAEAHSKSLKVSTMLPGVRFQPSRLIESDKILGSHIHWEDATADIYVKFLKFDTTTDTFDNLPATNMATGDVDFDNVFPSENTFYRKADNTLVAVMRWDESSAPDYRGMATAESSDDGATFEAWQFKRSIWGGRAGNVKVNMVGGNLWLHGYHTTNLGSTAIHAANKQTVLWQIDPDSFEPIMERKFAFIKFGQDTGNGDFIITSTSGNIEVVAMSHTGASCEFYKFNIPVALGIPIFNNHYRNQKMM